MKDTENLQDEIRQQTKKWKNMSSKERAQYFKDYYLTKVIVITVIVIALFILVFDIIKGSRKVALHVFAVNVNEMYLGVGELTDEFANVEGINLKKEQIRFDINNKYEKDSSDYDTIATVYKIDKYILSGEMDLLIIPEKDIEGFKDYFLIDLSEYMDEAWYAEIKDLTYTSDYVEDKKIDIAFYGDQIKGLYEGGMYQEGEKILIIPLSNSSHLETAKDFYMFWRNR